MTVYLCSSNRAKLQELAQAAQGSGFEVLPLPGLKDISPPEETGSTFENNASEKALYYSQFTPEVVVADDSGLQVDALGGSPGVLSARFAGSDADDPENNALLLELMKNVEPRTARFVCVVVAAQAGKRLFMARGEVEGEILEEPCGRGGFGYDPLFITRPFIAPSPN